MRDYDTGQRTAGYVLADKAATSGDRPFLLHQGRAVTYAELDEMTSRYANGFASIGVSKGDHVAIMMPNCPELLYALWGLGKLGAVAVPLNTAAKGELLRYFLDQSDSAVLCVTWPLLERVAEMENERDTLIRHLSEDPAVSEGLAAFAEKRPPDFAAFRSAAAPPAPPCAGTATFRAADAEVRP